MAKAIGQRGSWFADVEGQSLPCVHAYWMSKDRYNEPNAQPDSSPWPEFIAAIKREKKVILRQSERRDAPVNGRGDFTSVGYVAVFSVEEVEVKDGHLTFRFVKRLMDLD